MTFEDLKTMLKKHEGFKSKPYLCTAGKLTLGYGRNLEDNDLSRDEADLMLENDIKKIKNYLENFEWFTMQPPGVQYALIDMGFMGASKLLKFKKMIRFLEKRDYTNAALEALDSKWARDVKKDRANDIALLIRKGM